MTVVAYTEISKNSCNEFDTKIVEITEIFGFFCCCIYLAEIKVGNHCHLRFEKFVRKCFSDVMLRVTRHIRTHERKFN